MFADNLRPDIVYFSSVRITFAINPSRYLCIYIYSFISRSPEIPLIRRVFLLASNSLIVKRDSLFSPGRLRDRRRIKIHVKTENEHNG